MQNDEEEEAKARNVQRRTAQRARPRRDAGDAPAGKLLDRAATKSARRISDAADRGERRLAGELSPEPLALFHKQSDWEAKTPGLNDDNLTIIQTLNDGAHVSFKSLFMARSFYDHPPLTMTPERFADYIERLIGKPPPHSQSTRTSSHGLWRHAQQHGWVLSEGRRAHLTQTYVSLSPPPLHSVRVRQGSLQHS